jgi:hypothetical protein
MDVSREEGSFAELVFFVVPLLLKTYDKGTPDWFRSFGRSVLVSDIMRRTDEAGSLCYILYNSSTTLSTVHESHNSSAREKYLKREVSATQSNHFERI